MLINTVCLLPFAVGEVILEGPGETVVLLIESALVPVNTLRLLIVGLANAGLVGPGIVSAFVELDVAGREVLTVSCGLPVLKGAGACEILWSSLMSGME